jgi:hypothetical protein
MINLDLPDEVMKDWNPERVVVSQVVGMPARATIACGCVVYPATGEWAGKLAELDKALGKQVRLSCGGWASRGRIRSFNLEDSGTRLLVHVSDSLAELEGRVGSRVIASVQSDDAMRDIVGDAMRVRINDSYMARTIAFDSQYGESTTTMLRRLLIGSGSNFWCEGSDLCIGAHNGANVVDLVLERDILDWSFRRSGEEAKVTANAVEYGSKDRTSKVEVRVGASGGENRVQLLDVYLSRELIDRDEATALAASIGAHEVGPRVACALTTLSPLPIGSRVRVLDGQRALTADDLVVAGLHGSEEGPGGELRWGLELVSPDGFGCSAPLSRGQRFALGTVTQEEAGGNRVRVCFPWDAGRVESPWLRRLLPSGGKTHGARSRLEPGDSVLVCWGQAEIEPIVLGAVSTEGVGDCRRAAIELLTQGGCRVQLSGQSGESSSAGSDPKVSVDLDPDRITLQLLGGARAVIEKGTVSLQTDRGAASITAERGDIKLKAQGKIVMEGSGGVEIKAPRVDVNQI